METMETNALRAGHSASYGAIQGEQNVQSESLPRRVWNAVKEFFASLLCCIPTSRPDVSSQSFSQRVQTAPAVPENAQNKTSVNQVQEGQKVHQVQEEQKVEAVQQSRPPLFPIEQGHLSKLQTKVDRIQKELDEVKDELSKTKVPSRFEIFNMAGDKDIQTLSEALSADHNRESLISRKNQLQMNLDRAQKDLESFKPLLEGLVSARLAEVEKTLATINGPIVTVKDLQAMGLGVSPSSREVDEFFQNLYSLREDLLKLRSDLVAQK